MTNVEYQWLILLFW